MSFQSKPVHIFNCGMLYLFHDPIFSLISLRKAGRMMMNIRGLILDDPGNTIHLKSLHFAEGTYSDSETGVASR
jgi:hypothetical protein